MRTALKPNIIIIIKYNELTTIIIKIRPPVTNQNIAPVPGNAKEWPLCMAWWLSPILHHKRWRGVVIRCCKG